MGILRAADIAFRCTYGISCPAFHSAPGFGSCFHHVFRAPLMVQASPLFGTSSLLLGPHLLHLGVFKVE